jgi:hypothetical protein
VLDSDGFFPEPVVEGCKLVDLIFEFFGRGFFVFASGVGEDAALLAAELVIN